MRQACLQWFSSLPEHDLPDYLQVAITRAQQQNDIREAKNLRYVYYQGDQAIQQINKIQSLSPIVFPDHVKDRLIEIERRIAQRKIDLDKALQNNKPTEVENP